MAPAAPRGPATFATVRTHASWFTYEEEELLSEEEGLEEEDESLRQEFEQEPQTPIAADPAPHVEQALRTPQSASEFLDLDVLSLDDDMEQSPSIQVTASGRWDASDEVQAAEKIADEKLDESVAALEFGKDEDHVSEELRGEVLVSTADKIRDEVEDIKGHSPVEAGVLATVGTMLISMVASAAFEPAVEQITTELQGSFAGIPPGPTPFQPAVTEEDIESSKYVRALLYPPAEFRLWRAPSLSPQSCHKSHACHMSCRALRSSKASRQNREPPQPHPTHLPHQA
eukprot:COSAG04_NODE_1218_length_7708_cov_1.979629_8_plen_286_part_00